MGPDQTHTVRCVYLDIYLFLRRGARRVAFAVSTLSIYNTLLNSIYNAYPTTARPTSQRTNRPPKYGITTPSSKEHPPPTPPHPRLPPRLPRRPPLRPRHRHHRPRNRNAPILNLLWRAFPHRPRANRLLHPHHRRSIVFHGGPSRGRSWPAARHGAWSCGVWCRCCA